jgi:tetratricopeptide (TPR) repeat protein
MGQHRAAGRRKAQAMIGSSDIQATDPATLRDIVLDREAMAARLETCPPPERVWILTLLGEYGQAAQEGEALLARESNRFLPLLVLARAYQGQYRWHDAARLQEEALRLARTPAREATARHQIGQRLFNEARYRDAAAEFEWAWDLHRACGHPEPLILASEQGMKRARQLAGPD